VLGVDLIVLDRGVEPEAVAVVLAVIERRFERAPAATATPATAAASPPAALRLRVLVGRPVLLLVLL
jgi:hypothetical protein